MIVLALVIVFSLLAFVLSKAGEPALSRGAERVYLRLSILPFVLTMLVPASIGLTLGYGPESKLWIDRASWIGLALSATLGVWGGFLLGKAVRLRGRSGWPLGVAVVLSAGPAMLVLASVAMLYVLGNW